MSREFQCVLVSDTGTLLWRGVCAIENYGINTSYIVSESLKMKSNIVTMFFFPVTMQAVMKMIIMVVVLLTLSPWYFHIVLLFLSHPFFPTMLPYFFLCHLWLQLRLITLLLVHRWSKHVLRIKSYRVEHLHSALLKDKLIGIIMGHTSTTNEGKWERSL